MHSLQWCIRRTRARAQRSAGQGMRVLMSEMVVIALRRWLGSMVLLGAATVSCSSQFTAGASDEVAGGSATAGASGTGDDAGGAGRTSTGGASNAGAPGSSGSSSAGGNGAGIGTLGQPCSPDGAYACAGHAQRGQLVCDGGKWTSNGTCPTGNNCDSSDENAGFCSPVVSECVGASPAQAVCKGLTREACGTDLVSVNEIETCAFACSVGKCTGECTADQKRCEGEGVQTCGADSHWSPTTACPGGAACKDGECGCPEKQIDCGGACVDATTKDHCGACDVACTGKQACQTTAQGTSCQCPKCNYLSCTSTPCGCLDQNTGLCL